MLKILDLVLFLAVNVQEVALLRDGCKQPCALASSLRIAAAKASVLKEAA